MTPREPKSDRDRDDERAPNWREGLHGGSAEDSPDDFDEQNPDEQPNSDSDPWRASDAGAEANPDDYDEEPSAADASAKKPAAARQLHTELQDRLGDDYEVIFEAEGYQVRRAGDRAFVAEYIPDHQILRAGPHVLFHGRDSEAPEKLIKEGKERIDERIDAWTSFGFEPAEEGHLMGVKQYNSGLYRGDVPRYIQPMEKQVNSVEEVAESIEWLRQQRRM